MPRSLRIGLGLVALAGLGAASCGWLLPERYAVNAPLLHLLFGVGTEAPSGEAWDRLQVPRGYSIGLFAEGIANPRMLRPTPAGDLLVSSPRDGRVFLLARDRDGDGAADEKRTLLEGLNQPHGLDLREGWLYVAETDGVGRVRFDSASGALEGNYQPLLEGLPGGGNHDTRTLRFGPDGWMYVSIGSSCNVCEESDPRRAAILRARPDGSDLEIFATGLRNAVGFDWQPETGALYATDNGRDLLGDDFPPCELNRIERGGFYGWPHANGNRELDPDLGPGHEEAARASIPPSHAFRAHNAPLGITFLRDPQLPKAYRGAALVALHGSWNRTRKDGYRIVSLHWQPDGRILERDFATGFERDEDVIGRPVDVAEGPDGAIYVSDDYAGAIYRIGRGEAPGAGARATTPLPSPPGDTIDHDPAASARGRALYETGRCAGCHDADGAPEGTVVVPIRGLRLRYTLDGLTRYLATPTPPMPTVDLPEADRRDLAIHLLERHP